jgi:hypothetical protein
MTEIRQDKAISSTLNVNLLDNTDHLYCLESKKYKIYATSTTASPMVKVKPWTDLDVPADLRNVKSALIENLIIDGQNLSGIVGICLQNVYNCWIRNLTIKNCDVGIKLQLTYGAWSEFNRIEHIRMENVNTGILFTTSGPNPDNPDDFPGNSAGFTHIDDVGIKLNNTSTAVGVQIGDDINQNRTIDPYSAFIRANVWLQSAGGKGLQIKNGTLQYGLINLSVQGPSNGSGIGIDIQSAAAITANNQQFKLSDGTFMPGIYLACGGVGQAVNNAGGIDISDIKPRTY